MSDATDDLELAEFFGTSTPVRDMDGTWYTYVYNGEKYRFRTVQEANEWARSNGFSLTTQPTNSIDSELEEILENLSSIIATNHLENGNGNLIGYQERRKYDDKHVAEALQAIKAKYISRKEVEEAIDHKLKVLTVQNIEPFPNGQYINVKELRAKLLPPTKGDTK